MLLRDSPNYLLFVIFLAVTGSLHGQTIEAGVLGGFSVYSGDLSPKEFGVFFEDMEAAGGAYLRFRPSKRVAIRANAIFGRLSALKEDSQAPDINGEMAPISRNFRSTLSEFSAQVEIDLFYIGDKNYNYLAPYVYAGGGIYRFNPEGQDQEGIWRELQPLATEAQGSGLPQYDSAPYELTRPTAFVGGGIRYNLDNRFVFGVEIGGRFTGSDYLDDVTNTEVNYLDVLENTNGRAAFFSNPAIDPTEINSELDVSYRRGGEFNDYYFVGNITLGVLFGGSGGGRRGNGCYDF